MHRVTIFTLTMAIFVGLSSANPATAADEPNPLDYVTPDSPGFDELKTLLDRLNTEGGEILLVEKTFLGRLRILCVANSMVREVVISPNTGEIRRDIVLGAYDPSDFAGLAGPGQNGQGQAKGHDKENSGRGNANGKGK